LRVWVLAGRPKVVRKAYYAGSVFRREKSSSVVTARLTKRGLCIAAARQKLDRHIREHGCIE
jgi:hypothetical protein